MLSDEERKAINEVKHFKELTRYWQEEEYEEKEIAGYIGIVLNIIEKQSKEIEELNKSDTSKEQSSMNYYNLWREEKEKNKSLLDSLTRRIEYTNELEAVKLRLTIENNKLCNKQK